MNSLLRCLGFSGLCFRSVVAIFFSLSSAETNVAPARLHLFHTLSSPTSPLWSQYLYSMTQNNVEMFDIDRIVSVYASVSVIAAAGGIMFLFLCHSCERDISETHEGISSNLAWKSTWTSGWLIRLWWSMFKVQSLCDFTEHTFLPALNNSYYNCNKYCHTNVR